jgi:hypothetical protein
LFLSYIDGVTKYSIGPLIFSYLQDRSKRNYSQGLLLYSITHDKDCTVELVNSFMNVIVGTESYRIRLGVKK